MIILGIDPGQSGGVAWLVTEDSARYAAVRMPETEADFVQCLIDRGVLESESMAFVESVHSMPKQGVSSSFKFGQNYGMIRGVLAALSIRREFVSPQKWQRAMSCMTRGDKTVSKRRAQELFPHLHVTHAVADALLIAEYGRMVSARTLATEAQP